MNRRSITRVGAASTSQQSRPRGEAWGPDARLLTALTRAAFIPWTRWAAHRALLGRNRSRHDPTAGRFTRRDIRRLIRASWQKFDQLAAALPAEPTVGSRLNVRLAALTLAMIRVLLAEGIQRDYAIELIGDVCWKIYAQWGHLPRILARLRTDDPTKRMRIAVDMFLKFPFNPPGYRFDLVPEPAGRALDMLHCPVAEYLARNDARDLAVTTWCNLDFPLAHAWAGVLERHGSLASGAARCDFRFRAGTATKG